jgi:DNA mismatch repair protein MutS2
MLGLDVDPSMSVDVSVSVAASPRHATAEHAPFPDLLCPSGPARIDADATKLAMALAFAAGVSGGLFADALDKATLGPSTWDPSSFANDLFLREFVAKCFVVRIDGHDRPIHSSHLVRMLGRPPSDEAVVAYRRAIAFELVTTRHLRAELERLYTNLCRLRSLLEGATGVGKWDVNRRQLDILLAAKEVFDGMAQGFVNAKSGLASLASFADRVRDGEPYRSLVDLLRYDERLATLDLKVNVGADGRIRGFEIVSIEEDAKNPFVVSPWRRLLAKVELFVRGFRFSDGEVMARLVDAVFDGIADALVPLVQLVGDLELYLGALGLYDAAARAGLAMSLPALSTPDRGRRLEGLFNPLLLAHGIAPVPCTITTDRLATITLVTGPNSGGKTRLLQSLGLAQLLAQNGLFVPARSAEIALAPALVMSLIEEARADQSEGRLGTELVRIRALFEKLPPGALVILDELCSGTNPSEGEEIFELVVQMLARLEPQAFITTHFLTFAARLEHEARIPELRFLQVELSREQRPTYQFVRGVASTSLAGHAAARLGVTRDELLALIHRNARKHAG